MCIADLLDGRPDIRLLSANKRCSIGNKRNMACEAATGDIVIHWDDDDWYGPRRISEQISPILSGDAELSGLETRWLFDLERGEFWTIKPALHQRMFVEDVHGGTLAFAREVWDRGIRYPNASLAEDAAFLRHAVRSGMRLAKVPNSGVFVYSRHSHNAWRFPLGSYIDADSWSRNAPPEALTEAIVRMYRQAARECFAGRSAV